jgi:hypothetical protein
MGTRLSTGCVSAALSELRVSEIADASPKVMTPTIIWFRRARFPAVGDQLLFHTISRLYERTSVIVTTNLGSAIAWRKLLANVGSPGTAPMAYLRIFSRGHRRPAGRQKLPVPEDFELGMHLTADKFPVPALCSTVAHEGRKQTGGRGEPPPTSIGSNA